jgi:hypothetical protein
MDALDLIPFVRSIMPPDDEHDEAAMRSWRFNHSVTVLFIALAMVLHVAWACSLIPGLEGFAQASELKNVASTVKATQLTLLDQSIMEARRNECRAFESGNTESQRFAASRVRDLMAQWDEVDTHSKHSYPLPSCAETR